jgi:hypothetical protein
MNYLANALPINGKTTGELSDSFPNLFVPAGITFSIWGVIYLLLLLFCLVQFFEANQANVAQIGWLFAATCIFNALWIVCWHYGKLPLSLLVMLGLMVSLIFINMRLAGTSNILFKAAFGIYLGWICIATIANVTAMLVHYNWNGWGIFPEIWTMAMILAGMIITVLAIRKFDNPWIGFPVVWAFTGILIKRQTDFRTIVVTAAIAALIVGFFIIKSFILAKNP